MHNFNRNVHEMSAEFEQVFAQELENELGQEYENENEYIREFENIFAREFEREFAQEFEHSGVPPASVPSVSIKPRTIGFEFDVHYGLINDIVTSAGLPMPANNTTLTTHTHATDGFIIKLDGPRFEVSSKPFSVDVIGFTELGTTIKNIKIVGQELQNGCKKAKPTNVAGFTGKARIFNYTKIKSSLGALPITKLPLSSKFSDYCSVWASPQATMAIPLSKVPLLVDQIRLSIGKESGKALTGGSGTRMGLQSLALYKAKYNVDILRKGMISKRVKDKLSNGKAIDSTIFSENFRGFLILLTSYLWTSELPYQFTGSKPRDYEPFAKAYLPINVKAPFPEIFDQVLNVDEQMLFKEYFANGTARLTLFKLAKKKAVMADGNNKLFPKGRLELGKDSVHERQLWEFSSVPTWNDLIDHTLNASHNGWGNRLLVPISKSIGISKTFPNVALELRRVGFEAMYDYKWKSFMEHVFNLVKKL